MNNMKKIFLITILSLVFVFGMSGRALAYCITNADCDSGKGECINFACSFSKTPSTQPSAPSSKPLTPVPGKCVKNDSGQEICSLDNPLAKDGKDVVEFTSIISTVIKTALGIIGALTLLMLVWGGFQWLTSAGNPEKVKMGTQTMIWAIIGVALVFASYLLLSTFTSYLTTGTQ